MKLFLLKPIDEGDKIFWYDCNHGFVIRAESEGEAREIASKNHADEGSEVWLNTERVSCEKITNEGEPGIVLCDFVAG